MRHPCSADAEIAGERRLKEGVVACPPNQALAVVADGNLLSFTTEFYHMFPRELRNMVYIELYHIMNIADLQNISSLASGSSVASEIHLPRYLKVDFCGYPFVKEFVQKLYEEFRGFDVLCAKDSMQQFLGFDIFALGVTLSGCKLSKHKVEVPLRMECNHIEHLHLHLARDFAPLLHPNQRLAPGFGLIVVIRSTWNPDELRYGRRFTTQQMIVEEAVEALSILMPMLQALKPIFEQLKDKCNAEVEMKLKYTYTELD